MIVSRKRSSSIVSILETTTADWPMIECIVLAGGRGTRLQPVVRDLPKPMADIAGRPFLWWLMTRLNQQGVGRVILSLGYKSDVIQKYFGIKFEDIQIAYT